jgi:DNA-binding response OmpR family regulator
MRRDADPTRVVLLSGLGSTDDRIAGLEVGADDYLVKPFSPRELVLRIKALLRRAPLDEPGPQRPLVLGPLRLEPSTRAAWLAGRPLALAPREYELLSFLAHHAGRAVSARELLRRVWGWEFGDDSTVAVHVRRLREKLEPDPSHPTLLATVRGAGYRLGTGAELEEALTGQAAPGPSVVGP